MLRIKNLKLGRMETNCYILYDEEFRTATIIDPGDDCDFIINQINSLDITPQRIIATHGHFDHNMAAFELQFAFKIPYLISEKDYNLLKKMPLSAKYFLNINGVTFPKSVSFLKKSKKLDIGNNFLEIIELPGHTPGGIGLYNKIEKILFSGDVIFKNGIIGRYDFSYSDKKKLLSSIDRVLSLPSDTIIFPGHGEKTSVINEISFHHK
jgi:glyoxylase-like metal-dependent hydrolase (beta-lactamase superfamily II)